VPVKFTYGFQIEVKVPLAETAPHEWHILLPEQIPANASIWIPIFHADNITSIGLSVASDPPTMTASLTECSAEESVVGRVVIAEKLVVSVVLVVAIALVL